MNGDDYMNKLYYWFCTKDQSLKISYPLLLYLKKELNLTYSFFWQQTSPDDAVLQQSNSRLFIVWDSRCRLLHRGPDARVQGLPRLLQSGRGHWTLSIMPGPAHLFIEGGRTMLRFFTEQDDLQVWCKIVSYSLNINWCQFRKYKKLFFQKLAKWLM